MKLKRTLAAILTLALIASALASLAGCKKETPDDSPQWPEVTSDTLFVKQVENLPDDFIMGMDASSVISLEASGVKFYDFEGVEADVFHTLAANGINTIRVRVWNNPYDAEGNGFGGGNCDIETALAIGKRASAVGLGLLVDFHYSDFWADPAKQMVPRAWAGMTIEEKSDALYAYTKDSLQKLKDAGVRVTMVQLGNETNGKLCGESVWQKICALMSAGAKATREVCPDARIAVHFANPEKNNYATYASKLDYWGVDYDVFGSSYYPYWHGTLENLSAELGAIAEQYGKKVMVLETSYAFTAEDSDFFGNTIGDGGGIVKSHPFTVQGQANAVRDVIETMANTKNGIGVCYWEGTWISAGGADYDANAALWEKYGSGWASSFATVYDPNDAGKYYGGSAVDNQTFFDAHGKPLESLKVFALARRGNVAPVKADALEDVNMIVDLNGKITLPDLINAVMTDGTKAPVSVSWNVTEADFNKMYTQGPAKYDVTGTADGMTAHCFISMVEFNFLQNYSFEEDANKQKTPTGWAVDAKSEINELWVEEKVTDSLTGVKHFHFWADKTKTVEFTLSQTVNDLPAGNYKYSISIMGGDAGESEVYAFVKIGDEIVARGDLAITVYNSWDTVTLENIAYNGEDTITVGIYVKCAGENNGAWGKIDDALLNSVAS